MTGILDILLFTALAFTRHTVGSLSYTHDVSAADLDGDGDVDIVGAGRNSNALVWYEWIGPDNFIPHTAFSATGVIGCWAGDLDDDGDNDLAAATNSYLVWLANDGSGTFTSYTLYSSASCGWRVNVADVDSDGDKDILFADWIASDLFWFANDGSENFTSHLVDGDLPGAHEVWGLDLDGDGDCDLIGTDWSAGNIYWYRNNGAQSFTRLLVGNTGSASGCWDAFPYDIDSDGDPDIAATNYGGYVVWFENAGAGSWTFHSIDNAFGAAVHGVCAADFDRDGDGDVIATGYSGYVSGYQYPSWTKTSIDTRTGPLPLWPQDIDLDGDVDFVLGADGTVYWYENTTPMGPQEAGGEAIWALTAFCRGNELILSFALPAGAGYELGLYSATGARLVTLDRGVSSGEETRKSYPLDASAGVYYLVLMSGESSRSVKVVKR